MEPARLGAAATPGPVGVRSAAAAMTAALEAREQPAMGGTRAVAGWQAGKRAGQGEPSDRPGPEVRQEISARREHREDAGDRVLAGCRAPAEHRALAAESGTAGGANGGRAGGASGGGGSESGGTGGSSVSTTISFAPAVGFAARTPQVVTLADFNKDGKLDAATVSFSGDASVLLGNGNGTFQPEMTYISTAVVPGTAIVAADFNNDGNPDLAFSMSTYGFGTLLGNGDGTFRRFTYQLPGSTEGGLGAADLNGDGKLDVVMAFPRRAGSVMGAYVALGKGNGAFQEAGAVYTAPSTYAGLVLVDFNKDRRLDIVTSGGGFVSVLLGNGDGTFPFTGTDFPVASGTLIPSLAVGDLNGDGALDVVAPDSGGMTLNVFLGTGDGTLLAAKQFPCGLSPADVKVADLNLDGLPDIVATNDSGPGNAGTVAVLAGKGDGTFDPYVAFGTGMGPHAVSIGDLNGDTRPDLVVANKNDGTVSVLLNTSH